MRKSLFLMGLIALLALSGVLAQEEDENTAPELAIGIPATGTLDAETFAENYTFRGSEGDTVTITATTTSETLNLVLLITSPGGAIVAQDSDLASPAEAFITGFELPQNGMYIVTLFHNGDVEEASGNYTLVLSGSLTPPPDEETTTAPPDTTPAEVENATLTEGGIEISLAWSAAVNMDIEVRDPAGGSIYSESLTSPSGGSLAADINAVCEEATEDTPTEIVTWPVGEVPAGSYEIIVYYTDACTVGGPQQFSLTAAVNGEEAQVIGGTLNPGQQYLSNVTIDSAGVWALNNGGVNAGLDIGQLLQVIGDPQPLSGETTTGAINRENPGVAYTFEGTADTSITINMDATVGNLDSFLVLLAPNGAEVARNDDRENGNTNSTIISSIGEAGTYTIVATRFGQAIGGTEGNFTLTVAESVEVVDAITPTLAVTATPSGDATTAGATAIPSTITTTGTLPEGSIEVLLTWNTAADLQLLIRDPSGEAIFDDNLTSVSGGFLAADGNARCEGENTPLSYIYWPAPLLPRNTFEVEVWYQNDCDEIAPVTFTLTINVQGQEIFNQTQAIVLDRRYMTTFTIDNDGNTEVGETGFFDMTDANSINFFPMLADAEPIAYEDVISDQITLDEKIKVYSFEGISGDRIRIQIVRTGGTLDTALYLISPDNIPVAFNDDIVNPNTGERDTNSLIDGYTLEQSGTYYILATHYGLQFGGTTGTFNLSLFPLSVSQ